MLRRGIYLAPSQFEALFVSTAITDELVEKYLTSLPRVVGGGARVVVEPSGSLRERSAAIAPGRWPNERRGCRAV
ncbi:MAG: hypothetical protein WKG07_05380 [Hymenobacter sp.]